VRRFSLSVQQLAPDVVCVELDGELDLCRAIELESGLRAVERGRPRSLVIDLRGLSFIDSSGLARLVAARRRALRGGWRLALVHGTGTIERLFALSGLEQAFDVIRDPAEAVATA
jgi:anti-sigma B factor antagonist